MGHEKFIQSLGESETITLTFLETKVERRKRRRRACTKDSVLMGREPIYEARS